MIAIKNKLFIVEGLPGVGKSATAEYVAEYLSLSGENARWYEESDLNHPADYTFHAFMREDQIRALKPGEQRQVIAEGIRMLSGYVVPLTKISVNLFEKILPYKIYGRLDWETEKAVMREHWREFAEEWQWSDAIHVFDGCFLQNPVNEMMMRFDFGWDEIEAYIQSISDIIARLHPVVIYLRSTDIKKRIGDTVTDRRPGWLEMMVETHTSQGYGKRNNLTGFDGCIACLQERQQGELDIMEKLGLDKLVITDPYEDWDETQTQLDAYLKSLCADGARI